MKRPLRTETFPSENRSRISVLAKGQSLSRLTFQADFLAAEVEQSGVVSRVGRGHVQLQQHFDFGTLLASAEKSNTETQQNRRIFILIFFL